MADPGAVSSVSLITKPAQRRTPRLTLLGQWRLVVEPHTAATSATATGPVNRDVQRLIALIALRGPRDRMELREKLWPDAPSATSASRLRNALWRMSKFRGRLICESDGVIGLLPEVTIDVTELLAAAARVDTGFADRDRYQFEADLLPGWDEDWLTVDRERIRQTRLHALEQVSEHLLAEAKYAAALDSALAALYADPLRESAHRAVINVHLAEANMSQAIAQYLHCRAVLKAELGVAPSETLQTLMAQQTDQFARE